MGRYKLGPQGTYFDPNDSGPDQASPDGSQVLSASGIVRLLFDSSKGLKMVTPGRGLVVDRVKQAKARAAREHIEWSEVLAAMTPEQRSQVEGQ